MLILPPGHTDATAAPPRLTTRERWLIVGVLGVVVALALVLTISFVTGGRSSGHGCIYATIPGDVGAQEVDQCGATARETCASLRAPGAFTAQAAQTIATECRKAGLPVGP